MKRSSIENDYQLTIISEIPYMLKSIQIHLTSFSKDTKKVPFSENSKKCPCSIIVLTGIMIMIFIINKVRSLRKSFRMRKTFSIHVIENGYQHIGLKTLGRVEI